jgi:hypothetical protein
MTQEDAGKISVEMAIELGVGWYACPYLVTFNGKWIPLARKGKVIVGTPGRIANQFSACEDSRKYDELGFIGHGNTPSDAYFNFRKNVEKYKEAVVMFAEEI